MKIIILINCLLVFSGATFSQQTGPSTILSKQNYLKKAKKQKTASHILLGSGIGILVIDFLRKKPQPIYPPNSFWYYNVPPTNNSELDKFDNSQRVVFYIGCATALASIPFFISAHQNKKRGMSLSFKNETAPQVQKSSFVYRSIPSLNLKISL